MYLGTRFLGFDHSLHLHFCCGDLCVWCVLCLRGDRLAHLSLRPFTIYHLTVSHTNKLPCWYPPPHTHLISLTPPPPLHTSFLTHTHTPEAPMHVHRGGNYNTALTTVVFLPVYRWIATNLRDNFHWVSRLMDPSETSDPDLYNY
jgi:hypothetical protein